MKSFFVTLFTVLASTLAFAPSFSASRHSSFGLYAKDGAAKEITGKELQSIMGGSPLPLVVNAYASWCGTSTSLAPEFESAAKELNGKVQFVKLDTDKEEAMATRLNIMDTPTLIFYDFADGTKATLKGRSEGKITKEKILELCELYFPTRTVSQPTIVDEGINKPTGEKREFWWG